MRLRSSNVFSSASRPAKVSFSLLGSNMADAAVEAKPADESPGDKDSFKIHILEQALVNCSEKGLHIDEYITAYEELCIFFNLLGSVFGFITSDVKEKIEILRNFRNGHSERDKYERVERMMEHEIEVNKKTEEVLLGSRTLLRLHRALSFTMLFMEKLSESSDCEKASSIASSAYTRSLAKYHPWLIRKAATLAMYTLPSRGDMLVLVANRTGEEQVQKILKNCVAAIRRVYDAVEALYTKYDLHGLP